MNTFKIGDVVKTRGGGSHIKMTVMLSTEAFSACGWFDSEDHYHEEVFRTSNLEKG